MKINIKKLHQKNYVKKLRYYVKKLKIVNNATQKP